MTSPFPRRSRRRCVWCGRVGTRGFTDDPTPLCAARRACMKRTTLDDAIQRIAQWVALTGGWRPMR